MRLADFVLANSEPTLQKWKIFTVTIPPHAELSSKELCDYAQQTLDQIVADLLSSQSDAKRLSLVFRRFLFSGNAGAARLGSAVSAVRWKPSSPSGP